MNECLLNYEKISSECKLFYDSFVLMILHENCKVKYPHVYFVKWLLQYHYWNRLDYPFEIYTKQILDQNIKKSKYLWWFCW